MNIIANSNIIGNSRTMEFHVSDCYCLKLLKPKNRVAFSRFQEAVDNGYDPCGHCFVSLSNVRDISRAPSTTVSEILFGDFYSDVADFQELEHGATIKLTAELFKLDLAGS
jgi:hypothetical protein